MAKKWFIRRNGKAYIQNKRNTWALNNVELKMKSAQMTTSAYFEMSKSV
jgi:hypothetical protein